MKIVFVSGMLPSGHYSQYITNGLSKQKDVDLIVYTDKDPKNLTIKNCGSTKLVWSKSPKYILEIIKEIIKDQPDIIHLQQELNMYGGIFTATLFPLLVLILRLMRFTVVTTIHASVFKNQIDDKFVEMFHKNSKVMKPEILRWYFHFVFKSISVFSNKILVHTNLAKKILTEDYGLSDKKIVVVPIAIPQKFVYQVEKENYFFYFGYMVRRKGLGFALEGFRKYIENNPKSDFKFILAGGKIPGQEKAYDEIINIIKDNKLEDKVIVKGFIEEKEQDSLYQKAYAVVIPAILSMGSSGPFFHANSYGKCTIASNIGHFKEDIDNNKTGVLTENDMWDKAFELIAKDKKLVQEIESNVISKAKDRSPENTAKKYMNIYHEIV